MRSSQSALEVGLLNSRGLKKESTLARVKLALHAFLAWGIVKLALHASAGGAASLASGSESPMESCEAPRLEFKKTTNAGLAPQPLSLEQRVSSTMCLVSS